MMACGDRRHIRWRRGSAGILRGVYAILLFAAYAGAAVLRVGPGLQYETPCRAIAAAAAGDTIQIEASGDYRGDVCGWTANDLTLIGVNGRPKIDAAGQSADDKATWVISGDNTTVENIEFTGAAGPNHNGAAIRQEGANLTVRKCYMHGNEEGILAGDNPSSHILVEHTEFAENGYSDGQSHNIYVNHIARFTMRFSYSHDAISGHLVKSRALQNFILYNRLTGESGTSSIELDLPNGGLSYVIGNVIEQGPSTENFTIVAFGEEGASNPDSNLYFVNNTVANNRWNGVFIRVGEGVPPVLVQNNIFSGRGVMIDQPRARLSHNLTSGALFVDAAHYDYRLKSASAAVNFGVNPGTVNGYDLNPTYQYVHPACFETRKTIASAIDAGAFELRGGGGADSSCAPVASLASMILSPSIVGSGEHSKGTLRLTVPAPPAGVTVALSSSEAKVAAVPASVTIPADGMAADFTVTAGNVGSVTPVTISAGYGSMTKAASLEIHPANPAISSVTIPVRSIAGGSTVTATVKIANPSSSNETTITLMGLPPGVVLVPSSVTIPAGGSEATFQVRTASVKTSTRATIGAVYLGLTKTVSLTVTPSGK